LLDASEPMSPIRLDEDDEDDIQAGARPVIVATDKSERINPAVEYDVLTLGDLDAASLKTRLNELGQDGWLLVGTSPYFVFRRNKAPEKASPKKRVGFGIDA
jgi:hypothetical protein